MNHFLKICTTLMLVTIANSVSADMYVDRSIVIFEPGESPRQDIKVSNSDADDVYVQVEVFAIENSGQEDEKRLVIKDPRELKLLATPNKLVVPPNGQKLIRIVNLQQKNETERVYRINVTPIVPPLEDESSQLRIVVAYQILTIIQPDSPVADLQATRVGKQLTFSNEGNTNVLLSDGRQCNPTDPTVCEELTSRRLYAENSWVLDLPFDGPVTYSMRSFDGIKTELIP